MKFHKQNLFFAFSFAENRTINLRKNPQGPTPEPKPSNVVPKKTEKRKRTERKISKKTLDAINKIKLPKLPTGKISIPLPKVKPLPKIGINKIKIKTPTIVIPKINSVENGETNLKRNITSIKNGLKQFVNSTDSLLITTKTGTISIKKAGEKYKVKLISKEGDAESTLALTDEEIKNIAEITLEAKYISGVDKNGYTKEDHRRFKATFEKPQEVITAKAERKEMQKNIQAMSKSLGITSNVKNLAKTIQNNSKGKIAWVPATKIAIKFKDQLKNFINDFVTDENMSVTKFDDRWATIQGLNSNNKVSYIQNALKNQYAELYKTNKPTQVASNDELTFEPDDVRDAKMPENEQANNQEFEKQYREANSEKISKRLVKITGKEVGIADLGFGDQIKKIRHNGKIIPIVDFDKKGKQYVTEFTDDQGNLVEKYVNFNLNTGDLIQVNTDTA